MALSMYQASVPVFVKTLQPCRHPGQGCELCRGERSIVGAARLSSRPTLNLARQADRDDHAKHDRAAGGMELPSSRTPEASSRAQGAHRQGDRFLGT
jgi:hypothetical protein